MAFWTPACVVLGQERRLVVDVLPDAVFADLLVAAAFEVVLEAAEGGRALDRLDQLVAEVVAVLGGWPGRTVLVSWLPFVSQVKVVLFAGETRSASEVRRLRLSKTPCLSARTTPAESFSVSAGAVADGVVAVAYHPALRVGRVHRVGDRGEAVEVVVGVGRGLGRRRRSSRPGSGGCRSRRRCRRSG